jgi:hypothetical protein
MKSAVMDGGSPMENIPLVTKMDGESFISFLNKVNSEPPESASKGQGASLEGDVNNPCDLLQNGDINLTKSNKRENDFFESETEDNPIDSFLKEDEVKSKESPGEDLPTDQGPSFMDSFLTELVHSIKNALASIYHATVLTMDKYDDVEIRKVSHTQVKEDIKKIDSVLNSLLNFININTPIIKTNTLYMIFEEILEANEKQLRQKNIKIIKRCEKNLPETFIHTEQVRFILHSVLQYAILSTPPNETIGFVIKSCQFHDGAAAEKTSPRNNRRYIEVMMGFNGDRKPVSQLENLPDTQGNQREGMTDLILKLANEILQRNHGMMVETHGKRPKTLITLRFPIERRTIVYYAPIAL